jgi:cobalt-zinc-cadmium efflux system membrane fusion protein
MNPEPEALMGQPIVGSGGRGGLTAVRAWARHRLGRPVVIVGGLAVVAGLVALGLWSSGYLVSGAGARARSVAGTPVEKPAGSAGSGAQDGSVRLGPEQQEAVGLRTVKVATDVAFDVLSAPGRVGPNETQYAFITPRAAGVVRTVSAHIGMDVKAGDLLATIDSPEVGQARLDLYTRLMARDMAKAQADWQEKVHASTLTLLERIRKGETPEEIHEALADRPVGENRERLMTAYAQYRLAQATMSRNRDLYAQKLITDKQIQQVTAEYEVARSAYQSLMDQTGYESHLANTRASQALKQADAAVRAAQERLRILGVKPDGTEPRVERGKVVEVTPDGAIAGREGRKGPLPAAGPESILPGSAAKAVEPVGAHVDAKDNPVSTYCIWAPFDGTVLDREMVVPGVAVDTTHRIFTLANLATVWVEANVHESDFDMLARSRGGQVRFRSPAYPDTVFEGRVIYSGDLIDEKSRTIKLLAEAGNDGRKLKPGMFVDVEVHSPRAAPAVCVPTSALLTRGNRTFVYVRTGPERFAPREVTADHPRGETTVVQGGLEPGEEVVVEGGAKLKALAALVASLGP